MAEKLTRRQLVWVTFPASLFWKGVFAAEKSHSLPQAGEFVRYIDPTTEATVTRLTSPAYLNVLPSQTNRFVSLKSRMLFCSSDRVNGRLAPFGIDLRTGAIRQIAETDNLDPSSLCMDDQGHFLYFVNGGLLSEAAIDGRHGIRRAGILAKDVSAFGMGASKAELFVISNGKLRQVREGKSPILAEEAAGPCIARPGGRGCVFTRPKVDEERELWYAAAASSHPVMLAEGRVSNPYWSADGESLLFLRDMPKNGVLLSEVHEIKPEEKIERCVSKTSQFATFGPNGNDSVFVGASGSRAQPNIILLLRSAGRELTLCEHHSSNPTQVRPAFSPDSRRVYFQSDREGKWAIYSANVEQLVEPT